MKGDSQNIHKSIIEKSIAGNALAQEQLYHCYAKAMYNICRRMMGDEEEAKDILQDAFIDAFDKLPSLREINTFSLWIKRIVVNKCINALRKRKLDTTELHDRYDVGDEVQDDFEYTNYRASQIMEAVDHLPEGCRTVLALYLFEGYDHREIGQILSISESASKAQYSKAKARIRNQLLQKVQHYV
ncbi:MAG: sigma-70 family RNA polymerase sigma factor [Cyclobacteriaceae bacterium]|nr:sigma-70 family RNA polymerase sigma factor [Cyclobacteriaceae bacterium]